MAAVPVLEATTWHATTFDGLTKMFGMAFNPKAWTQNIFNALYMFFVWARIFAPSNLKKAHSTALAMAIFSVIALVMGILHHNHDDWNKKHKGKGDPGSPTASVSSDPLATMDSMSTVEGLQRDDDESTQPLKESILGVMGRNKANIKGASSEELKLALKEVVEDPNLYKKANLSQLYF